MGRFISLHPALTILFFLSGCQIKNYVQSMVDEITNKRAARFTAKHGDYFPDYISRFFASSKQFNQDFPRIKLAQSGLKLIEVKPLSTDLSQKVNESNLSWSADGAYLGYEVVNFRKRHIRVKNLIGDYDQNLAVIDNRKSNFLENMVSNQIISYNAGLEWSYNSMKYAFMSNGSLGEYNIYVGSIGEQEHSVASSPTKDGYATWSPRQNQLAFVSARSGKGDIYLLNLDNEELTRLTFSDRVDLFPEWFLSGDKIVFSSGNAFNHDLWLLERKTKDSPWHNASQLTNWNRDDLRPVVSPNGKLIAFYASETASGPNKKTLWNLHVIPYIPGKVYTNAELPKMIVAKDVMVDIATGPAWSPDGRKIFYVKNDALNFNPIYGYDLFSGHRFELKTGTKMNRDLMMSSLGVLSFRAQKGAWDKVYLALTNQGLQLQDWQSEKALASRIHYID